MTKHYFICTCGKKCRIIDKEIKKHLYTDYHHNKTLEIANNKAIQKLSEKVAKLFDNRKKFTDDEYCKKSIKYKKKFDFLKGEISPNYTSLWTFKKEEWFITIIHYVNFKIQNEYRLRILSKYDM